MIRLQKVCENCFGLFNFTVKEQNRKFCSLTCSTMNRNHINNFRTKKEYSVFQFQLPSINTCQVCNRSIHSNLVNNQCKKCLYKTKRHTCKFCKIEFSKKFSSFCSKKCNLDYTRNKSLEKIKFGLVDTRGTIRRRLIEKLGNKCQICSTEEWCSKPVPLVLDHINGNASDNAITNLQLICRNCDALSNTFSGKNRGMGRKSLGLKR